ncbi:Ribonuclease P protein subunit p40 [Pleodorina starrii]|nr:Ribonuclease P protein subunit p40 [Pleodorina starrii]
MLPPDEGYQVIRASLADVLAQVLNTAVLLQEDATLQAISLADRLESNHAIAITPDGMLHMAVSSEIHARLGLTGVNSPSSADRYNVSLDLRAASLQPGGDRYAQVLAKLRASIPPQAFIARLEAKGELKEIGLPSQALSPSYGTEAWMPLESVARTLPGLLLPPLSRETFEQLGVAPEPHGEPEPGPGGGDGDGGGDGVIDAMDDGGGGGGGLAAALRRSRSLPLTPAQEWRLQRAITGLHTWLGALACGQSHTLCNDLLPDEVMPLQLEDAPLPSLEEQVGA